MAVASSKRVARLLLVPLVVVVLATAILTPFHSAPGVDTRSYIEMITGVAKHGLPHLENGHPSRFPEMQARWNMARGDTLWGTLPPVFPYVAAPLLALGGLRAVSMFEISLCAALALAVFALGSRAARDPWVGVSAAYAILLATPLTGISFDLGPYMLSIVLFTWATYFALRAIDGANDARFAALAGLFGGLGVGAHLTTFVMFGAMMSVLVALPAEGAPWRPTRGTVARGAAAIAGAAVPLVLVGALDRMRFGSWNPISYGPCVWRSCDETGLSKQSIGFMLDFAGPSLLWASLTLVGIVVAMVRRSRTLGIVVVTLAVIAFVRDESLRMNALRLARTGLAFLVDVNHIDLQPFQHAPDGLGIMTGATTLKAPLQSVPFLALAFMAPFATVRERRVVLLLSAPCAALLLGLTLRANLPAAFALGYPFTNLRYVFPALPLAIVLAVCAVRRLAFGGREIAIALVIALGVGLVLVSDTSDAPHWRRFLLLRITLLVAFGALALAWLARRAPDSRRRAAFAGMVTAAAVGLSIAINLGLDLHVMLLGRRSNDKTVDDVAAVFPQRFALVGWAAEIDPPLSLRASRDIEYADMYEAQDWRNFRTLIDVWTDDHRPIYAIWPRPDPPRQPEIKSPWKEIAFDPVGDPSLRVVRVRKRDAGELEP